MILVDKALAARQAQGLPIRVAMVGAGFMGRGVMLQISQFTPGMEVVAVANRTLDHAVAGLTEAGLGDLVQEAGDTAAVERHLAAGKRVVTGDAFALIDAEGIDVVCDVTGSVEFGAHVTLRAFDRGLPVVTMNAELDGTVGPLLARRAADAGVIFSAADGDQPGVQGNLLRFVNGLGLEPLVAGNVKGLQDEHRNPTTQAGFAQMWGQDPYMVTSFADGTKVSFEQAIVANAHGFTVSRRGMNGWDHQAHVDQLTSRYDVEELRELGGIVDYVVGAQPGPGVYVIAAHDHPRQRHFLNLYKLGEGPLYSFYQPYHLCHFEVPTTIARVVDFGDAALVGTEPRVDVVAMAKVALKAGTVLDGLGGYDTYGVAETAATTSAEQLLPMGLAEGCTLLRDVAADTVISRADVRLPEGRLVDVLRTEQDAMFASSETAVPR